MWPPRATLWSGNYIRIVLMCKSRKITMIFKLHLCNQPMDRRRPEVVLHNPMMTKEVVQDQEFA